MLLCILGKWDGGCDPIEVEIPSLRVVIEIDLDDSEWFKNKYDELNLLEDKSLVAIHEDDNIKRELQGHLTSELDQGNLSQVNLF